MLWKLGLVGLMMVMLGCGTGAIGDECDENADCDSGLCLISCSSVCAQVKAPGLDCGEHYCADPESFDYMSSMSCYAVDTEE